MTSKPSHTSISLHISHETQNKDAAERRIQEFSLWILLSPTGNGARQVGQSLGCVGVSVGNTHRWGKAATFPGQPVVVRQAASIIASVAATVSDLQPRSAIPLRVCLTEVMASSVITDQDTTASNYHDSQNMLKNCIGVFIVIENVMCL